MERVGSWKRNAYAFYSMQAKYEHAMQIQGTKSMSYANQPHGLHHE